MIAAATQNAFEKMTEGGGGDPGALQRGLDRDAAQLVGGKAGEGAVK